MQVRAWVSILVWGCAGQGEWTLETWGEDYIEEAIPAQDFADACEVSYRKFLVTVSDVGLVDGNGELAAAIDGAQVYDVHLPGPHHMATVPAPVGLYQTVQARIAPAGAPEAGNASDDDVALMAAAGWSVFAEGTASCDVGEVSFQWGFTTDTAYVCEPHGLEVPRGGAALSELTIHGDHLFYDGLEDPNAAVRAEAIVAADADGDGQVTLEELAAVEVAPLGYTVGQFGEVRDLAAFVRHLTTSLGHIDGEGHCATLRAE